MDTKLGAQMCTNWTCKLHFLGVYDKMQCQVYKERARLVKRIKLAADFLNYSRPTMVLLIDSCIFIR